MLERHEESWSALDEVAAYQAALTEVCEEDQGLTWADGNTACSYGGAEAYADCDVGDIRIGDYILLIDCDTRVPKDCLIDAVSLVFILLFPSCLKSYLPTR